MSKSIQQYERRANAVIPPLDGTVTLPEVLDFHAEHNPDYPVFQFYGDGATRISNVSYLEFARASDRVGHYIRPGRRGAEGEIIAVIALSDSLLYHTVSLGLMRAGIVPFLMSHRNTAQAITKMLREVNCHKILTTQHTLKSLISEVTGNLADDSPSFELEMVEMPPLMDIYPKLGHENATDPFEPYPKAATRPDMDDVLLYLHSSGSTGFPKSIKETYRVMVLWSSFPPSREMSGWSTGCMHLPPFHTLGLVASVIHALYALCPVILYPPVALTPTQHPIMATPDNIIEHLRKTKANSLVTIPTLLQIWAQDQSCVDYLATLNMVVYAGGSVPTKLGNFLTSKGVKIAPVYGGTEFGGANYLSKKPAEENAWEWITFEERMSIRWDPQGDGTYECQFLTNDFYQASVENMGKVKGYATSDLFVPHSRVPGFWKIVGRKDDVIIHTSGEKTVPAPMENIIACSPYIMGAVIFGHEHNQPGVLIELKPTYAIDVKSKASVIQARNLVWPIIEEANEVAPAFSKIFKELILVSDSSKPLPRAGKGTVLRKAALALYNDEIEAMYIVNEDDIDADDVPIPNTWSKNETERWLKQHIERVLPDVVFNISKDLFQQGMDSLSSTVLRRRIVGALQKNKCTVQAAESVTARTIYAYPTIQSFSAFLVALLTHPEIFRSSQNRVEMVEEMIAKYSTGLSKPVPLGGSRKGLGVLITGTTGNLGSHVLELLLHNPLVDRIYVLNRASGNPRVKHRAKFIDKGFDPSILTSRKITFLESDITQKKLGLSNDAYGELLSNITMIIHNSWRLDFNLQLESFEPNVQGVRNLIDFARESTCGARTKFVFASSVASAMSWDRSLGAYPEEVIPDARYAIGTGYGESKYVAERIIYQSGVNATSLRIGQISGGTPNGAWATTDWLPILVKSSIALNALPSQSGTSSWIPMDCVAQCMIDVGLSRDAPPALNVVHPKPVTFDAIIDTINNGLVSERIISKRLSIVPISEWLSRLETVVSGASDKTISEVPAIKLLDFFRTSANADSGLRPYAGQSTESGGMAVFSTCKAQLISTTMHRLPPLDDRQMHLWVKYWKSAGLFKDEHSTLSVN